MNRGLAIFGVGDWSGLASFGESLLSGFTSDHDILTLLSGDRYFPKFPASHILGVHCLRERYCNWNFMAFILRQRDFLFPSVPQGHGLILALVIIFVLLLVIMGIAAVFVYRRWKKNRTMSGNNIPDEEIPMNPVIVQPAETVS